MGILSSRQRPGQPQQDVTANHAYKYPPRSGNYFGNHFIMGGERFDTPQPEAYLFGENSDLNFLGSRPTPFPYPPPQANEPTKTLKVLVNIRKESLKFVKYAEPSGKATDCMEDGICKSAQFNIEFTFDCDSRCSITVYYFCTEEVTPNGVIYTPRDPTMNSHTYRYKKGANQQFSQSTHIFDPSKYSEEDLAYNLEKDIYPVVIHVVAEDGSEDLKQSHTTIAVVEKHSDGTFVLKALKQKLFVDGLCYLLQEIYGIENKNIENSKANNTDEDCEDNGSECVICMCDIRDTLILPCRHLCLCNSCADSLRYQANNCPICRAPFRALLQIRALKKITGTPQAIPASPPDGSSENIPSGYEAVSLIEALNGPCQLRVALPPQTPQAIHQTINSGVPSLDDSQQAAESLNRCNFERHSSGSIGGNGKIKSVSSNAKHQSKELDEKSPRDRSLAQSNMPEYCMSTLLAREEENNKILNKTSLDSANNSLRKIKVERDKEKKIVNSYDTGDLETDDNQDIECENEADSDAEKLSPLLNEPVDDKIEDISNEGTSDQIKTIRIPLNLEAVLEPIDDTDTDEPEHHSNISANLPPGTVDIEAGAQAEDSDYFTPEDTQTTILTTPQNAAHKKHETNGAVTAISSTDSTPQRWALPHHITSLPGTPQSHLSNRSSGDSYSSSSSTKQLLSGNINQSGPNANTQNDPNANRSK